MAEMTKKRMGEFVRQAFAILLNHPDGVPAKELLAKLEQSLTLTDFEKSDYPNRPGVRRFEKIVRFATIAPVKAGWLLKSKGKWVLTEDGKKAYENFKDPETFQRKADALYKEWEAAQPGADIDDESDPSDSATTTLEEAEELAWSEIEKYLRNMNPYDLQAMVAALLRAMGYHVTWIAPPGPDKGIDILAYTDPLGTTHPRIKVQVKRHADSISVDGLRSFMAVLGDPDVGIFVSTGGFTSAAEQEARTQEKRKITLLDMGKLFDLWVQHYDQLSESDKRFLPLKPVYYIAALE
ncbi:MAG: Mrr restriction system protein [Candidatus Sulfotelmatobacter sp.]